MAADHDHLFADFAVSNGQSDTRHTEFAGYQP
jgi:hypothetical protein